MVFDTRQYQAVLVFFISVMCISVLSMTDYDKGENTIRHVGRRDFGISDMNVIMHSSESDLLMRPLLADEHQFYSDFNT